ncbi:hypothetical protein M758_UG109800 [Ceratodon purpureus]|nr:hypothetical protein M758_UG109800 [Ceratodon purpureus]
MAINSLMYLGFGAQETLLNLLLRNLHYNLYDHAEKLRSKTQRSDSHLNQQLCRYLYYLGKIRTIQLEYTDAKECLLQAARKAPTSARGFRIQCTKWAVIVRLLLGEILERTTFMQQGMRKALPPYFELTNVCISTKSLLVMDFVLPSEKVLLLLVNGDACQARRTQGTNKSSISSA